MSEQNVLPKVTIYQQYAGYADIAKAYGPTDDIADSIDDVPDPVGKFVAAAPVNAALAKADRGATVTFDCSVPESDIDDDSAPLDKGLMIHKPVRGPNTLAKKLGITRTEQVVTASGDTWLHGFGSDGELIDARLLRCAAE
jgi:hypothetical protein